VKVGGPLINKTLTEIEGSIEELQNEEEREPDDDFYGERMPASPDLDSRSIFDDVDE
jgi:hypothetical protein